jgi:hypothetical protein
MKRMLLSVTGVLICTLVIGQNGANLRMNLEKNKVYRLHSVTDQTVVQTVNGNQQTIESKTVYSVSLKMVDATQAFIVTEVRFDTISTKTNSMGKITSMSSATEGNVQSKETSDVVSFFMNRMTKNPLYAKIDFTGKAIEIVNSKMISDMVLKDTSLITLSDPVRSAVRNQIVNMVSDNSLKETIGMFTYNLPGKMVNTGESWSVTNSTNTGGMLLDITTSYKLDGISANKANISSESNIKASANAVPMEQGGARITYDDLKGLTKSTIIIDISTGLVTENTSKTHITGNLGVTVPGVSMEIPMDINSNSKVTPIQ